MINRSLSDPLLSVNGFVLEHDRNIRLTLTKVLTVIGRTSQVDLMSHFC